MQLKSVDACQISKVSLASSGRDFTQKLAAALNHNSNSSLTTINLANNPLEDRGAVPALTCGGGPRGSAFINNFL